MVSGRVRAYLVVVVTFVLGVIAGGAAAFAVVQSQNAARLLDDREDERRLTALTERLALDGAERRKIAFILNDARRETRVIAHRTDAKCGHPLLELRERVDAQVRAELRPDQQARFDALLEARRRREAEAAKSRPE